MENNGLIRITVEGDTAFVATETVSPKSKHRSRATNKVRRPKDPKPKEWLASELSKQKIADYKPFNFVDGEGVRCSLYVSGLSLIHI